jgi:hypothetical protein
LKPGLDKKGNKGSIAAGRPVSAKSRKTTISRYSDKPQGLNSYNSLNRANRIRSLANIIDQNKNLLEKLQKTKSTYNKNGWDADYHKSTQLRSMIKNNGDRYCKNPYFLHSLCTAQGPAVASTDHTSAYGSYKDNRTISQSGHKRNLRRNLAAESRASGIGDDGIHPPRIKKKQRPFSAPRH